MNPSPMKRIIVLLSALFLTFAAATTALIVMPFREEGTLHSVRVILALASFFLGGAWVLFSLLALPRIGRAAFRLIRSRAGSRDFIPPLGMNFQSSDALFPDQALEQVLTRNYEEQSSLLCYGDTPRWQDIKGRLSQLRPLL